ncbi:MAG: LysR family transcriptional regulator [Oscillospiraceae bacterium]|nr:LysR family transcriptional regulator [Oscillospiraceae bacterium]
MDINKIEVLIRSLELGSFSKAAEEYLYTPSAVSHMAKAVEEEVGTKLIKRTYAGVEVEDGAQEIIGKLKEILNLKREVALLAGIRNGGKNTVTIGTYASLLKNIIPTLIKQFENEYPDININIIVDDKMRDVYESGKANVFFGEKFNDVNPRGFACEKLFDDYYVAVFPQRIEGEKDFGFKESLSGKVFIMPNDSKTRKYMSEVQMENVLEIDSQDDGAIIQMVREGLGISVLPELSVKGSEGVFFTRLSPPLVRSLVMMYDENEYKKNSALRKFVRFTRKYISIE